MNLPNIYAPTDAELDQLKNGVFLTVQSKDNKLNVMTVGWLTVGVVWRVPVMMIAIRPNRYTYTLLENAEDFTVTFPTSNMTKELTYCGSISGRTIDKFAGCKLVTAPAKTTKSPIIDVSGRIYECKIINSTMLDSKTLDKEIIQEYYEDSSYHKMYFGKILSCYDNKR